MRAKTCSKCGEVKPLDSFIKNKTCRDGRAGVCKVCQNTYSRSWSAKPINKEQKAITSKEYNKTHRDELAANARWYYKNHREKCILRQVSKPYEKRLATWTVKDAIKVGRLTRPIRCLCGSSRNIEAHHVDYSKPLDVEWLCSVCHKARHLTADEGAGA